MCAALESGHRIEILSPAVGSVRSRGSRLLFRGLADLAGALPRVALAQPLGVGGRAREPLEQPAPRPEREHAADHEVGDGEAAADEELLPVELLLNGDDVRGEPLATALDGALLVATERVDDGRLEL